MDIKTVAIYSKEDLGSLHRYKADESFQIGAGKSPVAAYLSAEEIVELAKKEGVDAIHPGYGFLSESPEMVQVRQIVADSMHAHSVLHRPSPNPDTNPNPNDPNYNPQNPHLSLDPARTQLTDDS